VSALVHPVLSTADLLGLFGHFLVLSLLAIGGAITTAPDMHRYVVAEHHWISDAQFSASIAIAQAAPGPNVLFVAVIGWNVAGPIGTLATMAGTMLPSTALTLIATRWGQRRRFRPSPPRATKPNIHDYSVPEESTWLITNIPCA